MNDVRLKFFFNNLVINISIQVGKFLIFFRRGNHAVYHLHIIFCGVVVYFFDLSN